MLLTIDIGNSNIKLAVFDDDQLLYFTRFETLQDDYTKCFKDFFNKYDLHNKIASSIMSCVVPNVKEKIVEIVHLLGVGECIIVDGHVDSGIKIDTDDIDGVGSDLVVLCAYCYYLCKQATIVLSFGTANVLCYIDDEGCFKHCIISPGLDLQVRALFSNAAKLPAFTLEKQSSLLTNKTIPAMNIGIIDGTIGATNYLVQKLNEELNKKDVKIIACGGMGRHLVPYIDNIDRYIPDLVTEGLNYLYKRIKKENYE